MAQVLILADDMVHGERLSRLLNGAGLHDLYGEASVPRGAGLVIADICTPNSESMLRLQRALTAGRPAGVPFLYLIHGGLQRGEIQAAMLGATRTMPASAATAMLVNAVAGLIPAGLPCGSASGPAARVESARRAFDAMFTAAAPPSHLLADEATRLVTEVIRDIRVREWLALVAKFDDTTHRHCLTVAGLTAAFGHALGFSDADAHFLTKGALLHDIGKSRIPLAILNKPGPLDAMERAVMDRHPRLGYEMLLDGSYDPTTLAIVRSHHEMLDGSGYPDGLRGDEIPDLVRLVTICDIFAALIEERPYKAPKSADAAFRILTSMTGRLDGDLVRAFAPVAMAACGEPERRSA